MIEPGRRMRVGWGCGLTVSLVTRVTAGWTARLVEAVAWGVDVRAGAVVGAAAPVLFRAAWKKARCAAARASLAADEVVVAGSCDGRPLIGGRAKGAGPGLALWRLTKA